MRLCHNFRQASFSSSWRRLPGLLLHKEFLSSTVAHPLPISSALSVSTSWVMSDKSRPSRLVSIFELALPDEQNRDRACSKRSCPTRGRDRSFCDCNRPDGLGLGHGCLGPKLTCISAFYLNLYWLAGIMRARHVSGDTACYTTGSEVLALPI